MGPKHIFVVVLCMFVFFQRSVYGIGPILDSPRGYIFIDGMAVEECPEGTHSYMSREMGPTWSQKTCKEPIARDMGRISDMSRCDCDEPKVLDESTGNCVNLEDCPQEVCSTDSCTRSS